MARARRNGQHLLTDKMELFQVLVSSHKMWPGILFYSMGWPPFRFIPGDIRHLYLFHVMSAFLIYSRWYPPFVFIPCDLRLFDLFNVMAALMSATLIYSMWWPPFWCITCDVRHVEYGLLNVVNCYNVIQIDLLQTSITDEVIS